MSTPEPLPLHDVVLDDKALAELLVDIEHAAQLVEVVIRQRGVRTASPPSSTATLADAQRALREKVASVQLRYRFGGDEWWDTLMPVHEGIRLVRINHTHAVRTADSEVP